MTHFLTARLDLKPMLSPMCSSPGQFSAILWMDKILHHFEAMGSPFLLVFTGKSNPCVGFVRRCDFRISQPSTVLEREIVFVHPRNDQKGILIGHDSRVCSVVRNGFRTQSTGRAPVGAIGVLLG